MDLVLLGVGLLLLLGLLVRRVGVMWLGVVLLVLLVDGLGLLLVDG